MSQPLPKAPCGHIASSELTANFWDDEDCIYYQVTIKGFCVTRRHDNHMINGTKLLNVTALSRSQRDWTLKLEQTKHIITLGPMHLKGVWIPFGRALELANRWNITGFLYPLFVHDISALLHHPMDRIPDQPQTNVTGEKRRRSRFGCYTCRLRGKKCDEGQNRCRLCRNLGLQCEYQQPQWWKDKSLRKSHKAHIKSIIRQSPPLLCSLGCDLNQPSSHDQLNVWDSLHSAPNDVDTLYQDFLPPLSDFQTYVSDMPVPSASTCYPPSVIAGMDSFTEEQQQLGFNFPALYKQ